ncbi:endo-beta-D-1,4-glucanase [Blakeslea trispora]|nr:endo-beta-D-1,4-glucanase [Blakeslea trispora]
MKFTLAISTIAVALALTGTVDAADCNKPYGQCGGVKYKGDTCCPKGYSCQQWPAENRYYSQCRPEGANPKPTTTSTRRPVPTSVSGYKPISGGFSGKGTTTQYWDCCKASCGWPGKGSITGPVDTCDKDGVTLVDETTTSICDGGEGYMCNSNQPWAVNDSLAYGFAAVNIAGSSSKSWCCTCMELTFTNTAIAGKKMVVQVTNSGDPISANHFDLQVPGSGVGVNNGCSAQWNAPKNGWGQRYGGIKTLSDCNSLPAGLRPGCKFRFNWFENAPNPTMTFKEVTCPPELLLRTGCSRV